MKNGPRRLALLPPEKLRQRCLQTLTFALSVGVEGRGRGWLSCGDSQKIACGMNVVCQNVCGFLWYLNLSSLMKRPYLDSLSWAQWEIKRSRMKGGAIQCLQPFSDDSGMGLPKCPRKPPALPVPGWRPVSSQAVASLAAHSHPCNPGT